MTAAGIQDTGSGNGKPRKKEGRQQSEGGQSPFALPQGTDQAVLHHTHAGQQAREGLHKGVQARGGFACSGRELARQMACGSQAELHAHGAGAACAHAANAATVSCLTSCRVMGEGAGHSAPSHLTPYCCPPCFTCKGPCVRDGGLI